MFDERKHRCIWLAFGVFLAAILGFAGCSGSSGSSSTTSDGAVHHGIELNAANTGVPAGRTLHDVTSSIVVTDEWIADSNGGSRVLEDRNFVNGANLQIKTGDFTVRYCKFNGMGGGSVDYGLQNVVIEWSEFDGQNVHTGGDPALGVGGFTARRLHIHGWPRGFWFGWGNLRIEECYIHDVTADGGDAHLENVYVAGGANQVFVRNKFITNEIHIHGDTRMMTSASLAIYNEDYQTGPPYPAFPALDGIVVQDNYFESDGHYAMYCGALAGKTAPYARNMRVTGNIFGRGLHRNCGVSGPAVSFDPSQPGNVWSDNTWGPKGSDWVAGDPEEGEVVGAPGVQ